MFHPHLVPASPLSNYLEHARTSSGGQVSHGLDADGYEKLYGLSAQIVSGWLSETGKLYDGMDAQTRAAFLVGQIAWDLGLVLASLRLCGRGVPAISKDSIAAALSWQTYSGGGHSLSIRFRLLSADTTYTALGREGINLLIVETLQPLVEQLASSTRLSRAAAWRLVTDGIAYGWLQAGKSANLLERAMSDVEAILHLPGSVLSNKQVRFVEIIACDESNPHEVIGREWFRLRGGCCRYYTTSASGGEYCTTCVLREPQSQVERLESYLRECARAAASA